jgi:DNA-binding response OmpR family regulator
MHAHRILLVDDDQELAANLAEQLERTGDFAPVIAHSATDALAKTAKERFEAILLDLNLPDLDGRDLCRLLRRNGIRVPILMLTAAASDADAILSLNSGADDYVSKPFSFPVLAARLRAQLRKLASSDSASFAVGTLTFRAGARQLVARDGRRVGLTRMETEILKQLCRSRGQVVAREDLLRAIWGEEGLAKQHSLETHVYRLRQKIETESEAQRTLVTEGKGYRLL